MNNKEKFFNIIDDELNKGYDNISYLINVIDNYHVGKYVLITEDMSNDNSLDKFKEYINEEYNDDMVQYKKHIKQTSDIMILSVGGTMDNDTWKSKYDKIRKSVKCHINL